jgi:hypothetical protein
MVWVKCTTSAECKSIRIAASSVMDGCGDHYIDQCQVFGFINGFLEKWRFVPTAYLEGTAGAREVVRSTRRVLPTT